MKAAVCSFLFLLSAPAVALEVTAVSSSGTVVLDGCIHLRGLTLTRSDGHDYAVLPAYPKGRRGPLPADARLISRGLHERIVAALKSGAKGDASCSPAVTVRSLAPLDGSRHLADAAVALDGELELVYGIVRGAGGTLKVSPRGASSSTPEFSVTSADLRGTIEKAVLSAFGAAQARRK